MLVEAVEDVLRAAESPRELVAVIESPVEAVALVPMTVESVEDRLCVDMIEVFMPADTDAATVVEIPGPVRVIPPLVRRSLLRKSMCHCQSEKH